MNRSLLGALAALLFVAMGIFWWQGRASVEQGAPPPELVPMEEPSPSPEALPSADVNGMKGPAPPEASEATKEQRRFARYDRNLDKLISRNEMMATRTKAFRKLDKDGNNLLDFEEWAFATANKFKAADADGNLSLTPNEFLTTKPKPVTRPSCKC